MRVTTEEPAGRDGEAAHKDAADGDVEPAPRGDARWTVGCVVALTILTVLAGLGAVVLQEFEEGLDGTGQIESADGAPDGSVADPFSAGDTARYEDGLQVTVGDVARMRGGARHVTVTFENGTDEPLPLESGQGMQHDRLLDVCAGEPLDDCAPDDARDVTWVNADAATAELHGRLAPGDSLTVPVQVQGDGHGTQPVTLASTPYSASDRDTVYWRFDIG